MSDEIDHSTNEDQIPLYNMKHQQRGKLLIFNNQNFKTMNKREGSDRDTAKVFAAFKKLGFKCKILKDQTNTQMKETIYNEANADHDKEDCFAICILTHGDELGIYGVDEVPIVMEDLVERLKSCSSLAGKPKLIFVETSLGNKEDEGVTFQADGGGGEKPSKIPIEADFLYSYSTVQGYKSLRTSDKDSWYINALCDNLKNFGKELEMTELLTRVNFDVASKESDSYLKQNPSFTSMLTKLVYF